jgi:hypothetical protein
VIVHLGAEGFHKRWKPIASAKPRCSFFQLSSTRHQLEALVRERNCGAWCFDVLADDIQFVLHFQFVFHFAFNVSHAALLNFARQAMTVHI